MTLFSAQWYRVENLKPVLKGHVRIDRHVYRGQRWYVLQDPVSGRNQRFNDSAYYIIALMDGQRSVSEIWDAALTHLGDDAPGQNEMITMLARLHAADVLQCDIGPDSAELFERFTKAKRQKRLSRYLNPMFARIPIWDPDAWLERNLPRVEWLFHPLALVAWVAIVGYATLLAGVHLDELTAPGLAAVLDPMNLLILLVAYPIVKTLHELGHAFTTRVFGGEVHEVGVMFLVMVPMPYVDASASSSFRDKWKRILVSASGVMVELFISALALLLWLEISPGFLRSVLWNVMLIGGASTLFFNGNPLLRFDGYYALSDLIEIPNLASRSGQYLSYLFEHYVLGLPERRRVDVSPGERVWFVLYGITSWCYRTSIGLGIGLYLASRFFFLGVLLAVWSVTLSIGAPLVGGVLKLQQDPRVREGRLRVVAALSALGAAFVLGVFVLPIPAWTTTEGVVWLPERSQIRAGTDGFVLRIAKRPGSLVPPGERLIETVDPLRLSSIRVLEARLAEAEARRVKERQGDYARARMVDDEIVMLRGELRTARSEAQRGTLTSPDAGRFVVAARDLPGRFVQRGEVLGYVANLESPTVRTVVGQDEIEWVLEGTERVEVRLAERPGQVIDARIERIEPSASDHLPSMALGARGGGALAIDSRDPEGLTATEPFFQLDLTLPYDADVARIGGRVFVRFDHEAKPLFGRATSALRRLFMEELGV
jgi:putative peptide zinc metalloprotease protein